MNPDNYDPLAAYLRPSLGSRLRKWIVDPRVRLEIALTMALVLGVATLYGGFLRNPLFFDDNNVLSQQMLAAMAKAPFDFSPRWLTHFSFTASYRLAGTDWFWYRLGNLGLHAITVILLYRFFRQVLETLDSPRPADWVISNDWLAFFGAVWFALHPAATYGVGYLVERSIVMATLFSVGALYCYILALTKGKAIWFGAALLCYFLALSSKEHAIMVPGVAIALSLLVKKPAMTERRKYWLPAGAVAGLSATTALLFISYQKSVIGTAYEPQAFEILTQMREQKMGPTVDNAFLLGIATQAHLFFRYLLIWAVPYTGWMSIDIREPFATGFSDWPYAISVVAFLAYPVATVLMVLRGGRIGLFGLGMIYPWLMFLPELSVVRIQEVFVLYRSYLWMSGLPFVLLALAFGAPRRIVVALFVVLIPVLSFAALNRLDTMSDPVKLWTDAIEKAHGKIDQGAERPYFQRGNVYSELGRYEEAISDFKAAYALQSSTEIQPGGKNHRIVYFQIDRLIEATGDLRQLNELNIEIRERPSSAAYLRRGKLYARIQRPLLAVDDFTEAIRIDPDNSGEARRSRAIVLFKSGGQAGPAAALDDLNRAIAANPRFAKAYMSRGTVLAALGDPAAALSDFDKAIALAPTDAEIQFSRGSVLLRMRRFDEALRHFDKALALDPMLADAHLNRGGILAMAGRIDEAIGEFDATIQLNPLSETAYMNRAKMYFARGEKEKAFADLGNVLKINPQEKEALYQRALLLAEQGFNKEARISLQRSCAAGNDAGCEKVKELAR